MTEPYCSDIAATESMIGTAPYKRVWFIIEQPGAWGADALLESDLPPGFGADLKALLGDSEVGLAVARRPDVASVERRTTRRRRLWLAHTSPGGVRMRAGSLDDIRDVLKWDWQAILRGELPPVGRRSADPVLFVCTNGKKDLCCALKAREIVDSLRPDPELTGQVYEVSHLTGHRFAPTALLLPWGHLYGRLSLDDTKQLLTSAWSNSVVPAHLRGRTSLPGWAQAAEVAVRQNANVTAADALDVVSIRNGRPVATSVMPAFESTAEVQVRHQDGRTWRVGVSAQDLQPRKVSCKGEAEAGLTWNADSVTEVEPWYS
jgi:hypothetical protein